MRDMFASSVENYRNWFDGLNEELGDEFYGEQNRAHWTAASPEERGLWLTGKLWNDRGIMPSSLCRELDLPEGSRYSQGARKQRIEHLRTLQPAS